MESQTKRRLNYKKTLIGLTLFFSALIIIVVNYKTKIFGHIGIDELNFYLFNGMDGSNYSTFISAIVSNILPFFLLFLLLCIPLVDLFKEKTTIHVHFKTKKKKHGFVFNPLETINKHLVLYALIISIGSVVYASSSLRAVEYVVAKLSSSTFFEENYVNPKNIKLTFPEEKRNLIYIYLESMENTVLSTENGGMSSVSLIPELESLIIDKDNISFSNKEPGMGMHPAYGTGWTVAGMVSHSAGVPILLAPSIDGNALGQFNEFLPGAYSLGEILEKENYYQQLLIGSEAAFGGRDKYFAQHGNYNIFDYLTAKEKSLIDKDYKVWWGYEDKKLFEYAKSELTRISQEESRPFNFQLLTADTHFVDGHLDDSCATNFNAKYKNVYACSSNQIYDFVNWVKQQDFYENTTVIIIGDHLGMQKEFYEELVGDNDYERTIYNVIINSPMKNIPNNNRIFTSFDMYPTTLSSLGVEIEGNKLGLGVNLFSNEQTLAEKFGIDYMNSELQKRSEYYKSNILTKPKE